MATKSLGTTFTFTPAGGSAAKIGQLSAISELNCDSELIDVTTLSEQSGCRRFIQGARDAGEIRLTGFHLKTGAAYTFPALVKSCSLGAAQVDGAIGFGCVLRVNGAVESVSA